MKTACCFGAAVLILLAASATLPGQSTPPPADRPGVVPPNAVPNQQAKPMVTRVSRFEAAEGKEDELHELLRSVLPHIAGSEGNRACELLRSTERPGSLLVIERWESIEHHRRSLANFPQDQMQAATALLAGPPQGDYYQE